MLGNTITKFMSCLVLNFQNYLNKSKFFYLFSILQIHNFINFVILKIMNLLYQNFCSHFFLAREFLKST